MFELVIVQGYIAHIVILFAKNTKFCIIAKISCYTVLAPCKCIINSTLSFKPSFVLTPLPRFSMYNVKKRPGDEASLLSHYLHVQNLIMLHVIITRSIKT
jgi:hypothetical protein